MLTQANKDRSLQKWDDIIGALISEETFNAYSQTRPQPRHVCGLCDDNFGNCKSCPLWAIDHGDTCHPLWHEYCDTEDYISGDAEYQQERPFLLSLARELRSIIYRLPLQEW